jgi:hypothetical protein
MTGPCGRVSHEPIDQRGSAAPLEKSGRPTQRGLARISLRGGPGVSSPALVSGRLCSKGGAQCQLQKSHSYVQRKNLPCRRELCSAFASAGACACFAIGARAAGCASPFARSRCTKRGMSIALSSRTRRDASPAVGAPFTVPILPFSSKKSTRTGVRLPSDCQVAAG